MAFSNFNWVTERLATGGGPNSSADIDTLVMLGITHLVDCRVLQDPVPLADQDKLFYLYNPTEDDGKPKPVEWFKKSIDFVLPALTGIRLGERLVKVYAHCDAGINRGPSTAYAILRALTGMTHDDTKLLIVKHRPIDIVGIRYAGDADNALITLGYVTKRDE